MHPQLPNFFKILSLPQNWHFQFHSQLAIWFQFNSWAFQCSQFPSQNNHSFLLRKDWPILHDLSNFYCQLQRHWCNPKKSSRKFSFKLQKTNVSSTFTGRSEFLLFSPFSFFFPLERVQPARELTVKYQKGPIPEKLGRSVSWISPHRKHTGLSECPALHLRATALQSRVTSAQQWVPFTPRGILCPLVTYWLGSVRSVQSINRENSRPDKNTSKKMFVSKSHRGSSSEVVSI